MSALVGRVRERTVLHGAVEAALAGRGGVTLVHGEPGIGKSALVHDFVAHGRAAGLAVAVGRAWEAGGAPPCWPWIEILRQLVGTNPEALAAIPGLAAVSELMPELALGPVPALEPGQARFRLFDAVTRLLRHLACDRALGLVLEDLHAADRSTVELLCFAASRLRDCGVAVIATQRDVEARRSPTVGPLLAQLSRDAVCLSPARLGADAVRELASRDGVAPELAAEIHRTTEGNPLFVVECLRLLHARGAEGLRTVLSDGVRQVLAGRFAALEPTTIDLLELAAAQGREFDLPWLRLAADVDSATVEARLRGAIEADIVTWPRADRSTFTHVLLRDHLYDGLAEPRRVELHHRLVLALARREGLDPRTRAMGLAHHSLEAAPRAGIATAVEHAVQAASRALELQGHEQAVALLERALAGLDLAGDDGTLRFSVLVALGRAHMRAQDAEPGRTACLAAAAIARGRGDAARLAEAALAYGELFTFAMVDAELVALLREALDAVGSDETPLRARLLGRLASALQPAADPTEPIALGREAIAIARRVGDAHTRLGVITAAGSALAYFADPSEREPLDREMVEIARVLGDTPRRARGLVRLVVDSLERGAVAAAEGLIEEYAAVADDLALPAFRWSTPLLRAMVATLQGRFDRAEALAEEARGFPGRPDDVRARISLAMQGVARLSASGRLRELAAAAEEARTLAAAVADDWYADAFAIGIAARLGEVEEVGRRLAQLAPRIPGYAPRPMATWVAEGCVLVEDRALAERLHPMLASFGGRNHAWGIATMVCEGPILEARGRLSALLGRTDQAVAELEQALERCTAMGAEPHAARVASALAELRAGRARSSPTGAERAPTMTREGEVWRLAFAGTSVRLKDSRGLQMLARLLSEPGRELHVLELDGADPRAPTGDAGEALDAAAIATYRDRAATLRAELDRAETWSDLGRAEALRGELDALERELLRGVDVRGRGRREGSAVERARVNVRRRLVEAIGRIAAELPALGTHLSSTIRTGTTCAYLPGGRPISTSLRG